MIYDVAMTFKIDTQGEEKATVVSVYKALHSFLAAYNVKVSIQLAPPAPAEKIGR